MNEKERRNEEKRKKERMSEQVGIIFRKEMAAIFWILILIIQLISQFQSRLIEEIKLDGCPDTWTEFQSKCYKIVSRVSKSFEDAERLCRANEADLIQIKNEDTQIFVNNITFPEHHIKLNGYRLGDYYKDNRRYIAVRANPHISAIWLGIKPIVIKNLVRFNASIAKYQWLDGTSVTYHNFAFGDSEKIAHENDDDTSHNKYGRFYGMMRVSNTSILCGIYKRNPYLNRQCMIGEWKLVYGSMTIYEVAAVLCQKDALIKNSSTSSLIPKYFIAIHFVSNIFVCPLHVVFMSLLKSMR